MEKNIGTNDAAVRIILALLFIALWGLKIITGGLAVILFIIGAIFVFTAVFDYCPLYGIFGVSSRKKEKNG